MTVARPCRPARTILVAQHNAASRNALCVALVEAGYEVLEAESCAAALEIAAQRRPDLFVQDLVFPDMDGLELARSMRTRLGDAAVPFICVSGFLSSLEEARAMESGFAHVLVKPVDPRRLLELVGHYVAPPPVAPPDGERRGLVLIDDDPVHLEATRRQLSGAGFDVFTAPDGLAGLELARQRRPAVIVSDLHMPRMDGFALCLSVRRDEELRSTPVILTSWASVEAADRTLASRVGASALLSRSAGLAAMPAAVLASLRVAPPPADLESSELAEGGHVQRALWQLEHQVEENTRLLQRSTLRDAQLVVLAGVAEALANHGVIGGVLGDVLAACLDMAGISRGALYLTKAGRLVLEQKIGFSKHEIGGLHKRLGCEAYLDGIVARGAVVLVPSPDVPPDVAAQLVLHAGVRSLLLVPVRWDTTSYGLMVLGSQTIDLMGNDAVAFASVLGTQMGLAIGLAQTFANLTRSEQRYRNLTENANDAIAILTADGTITEVNRRLTEMLGYPASMLVGRHIRDFALPGPENDSSQSHGRSVAFGDGQAPAVEILKADGGVALVEFSLTPFATGGEQLVLAIGRDVSEQVHAQAQLITSDRMASVGTLAAGVAHEINNPLAAVIANLEFALEDLAAVGKRGALIDLADLENTLRDARIGAERVRVIVKDLKIFSRAEEDRRTSVDTERVLESTLRMAWNEIRHRARLIKTFGPVPLVEANESRLGQLFLNLIINAAQAIPEGHADRNEIEVTTSTQSGRVVVEIRDTGPGIPPEVLKKLFTPFFTTKPAGVGTGLGLVICQRIVTDLGGELTVASQVAVGTVFKVVLHAARSQALPDLVAPRVVSAMRRGKILVVDDDEMLRQALSRTLSREHDLELVTCATEALAFLDAGQRYDVILCDMMMPVLTGAEFYEQVLVRAPEQAERIVFLTAGVFSGHARDFLARVTNICIEKPYDARTLRGLMNELVHQAHPDSRSASCFATVRRNS